MLITSGVGRLGQEPKLQYTPSGTAQLSMSIAVDCGFGDKKETVWLSGAVFGNQAESLVKYLGKGSKIAFSAELTSIKPFTKQDESLGVYTNVRILTVEFLSTKTGKENQSDEQVEEF